MPGTAPTLGLGRTDRTVTGYGNQGDTTDIGIAILEPGTTRNHAYVALTRGRHANHAIIPDPDGTTDPAEALATIITRTPHHDSALAVQARLHEQAGLPDPAPPSPLDLIRVSNGRAVEHWGARA